MPSVIHPLGVSNHASAPNGASKWVSQILSALLPPPDRPAIARTLETAGRAAARMSSRTDSVGALASTVTIEVAHALDQLGPPSLSEARALTAGRATAFPVWTWFATAPDPLDAGAEALAGAELLLSLVEDRPFRPMIVTRLRDHLEGSDDSNGSERLIVYASKLLRDVAECIHDPQTREERLVRSRVLASLHQRLLDPNLSERKACGSIRELTPSQAHSVAAAIRRDVEAGEIKSLIAVIAACTGLPQTTVEHIPFNHVAPDNWVARVDAQRGIVQIDLQPILNLTRGRAGHEQAAPVISIHLPCFAAERLRMAVAPNPGAKRLMDLKDESPRNARKSLGANEVDLSLARLTRTRATLAIESGIDRGVAALATLDLSKISKPSLHYLTMRREEIWAAQSAVYKCLGWGAPVDVDPEPNKSIGVGSMVTPMREIVVAVDRKLQLDVEACRPGRKYTLASLEKFHNAYVLLVAHRTQFFTAARRAAELQFHADWLNPDLPSGFVSDKLVGPHRGLVAVAMPMRLREQLMLWKIHLQALGNRLQKLSPSDLVHVQDRIDHILEGRHVQLFFRLNEGELRPIGTQDLFDGHEHPLQGDAWRHFMPNALRHQGLHFAEVSTHLRHYVEGVSVTELSTAIARHDIDARMAHALDMIGLDIGMNPVHGLRRAKVK